MCDQAIELAASLHHTTLLSHGFVFWFLDNLHFNKQLKLLLIKLALKNNWNKEKLKQISMIYLGCYFFNPLFLTFISVR